MGLIDELLRVKLMSTCSSCQYTQFNECDAAAALKLLKSCTDSGEEKQKKKNWVKCLG